MDKVMAIANKHKLKVIEDCSHAHGSKFKGRPVGTFGDVAVFSLQAAKMIYAGEGGILVTDSEKIHDLVTALGHYRDRTKEEVKDLQIQQYWVTGFGQKYRMSPLNAVVAKHSLLGYPERKRQRHAALTYFSQRLKSIPYIEVPKIAAYADMGAWYGFKPLFRSDKIFDIPCSVVLKALQAEGVEIALASAPVLSSQPLFSSSEIPIYSKKDHPGRLPAQRFPLPVAEDL
jgi:dTDP-4-amino-4,6-dideoxygalactose transaminase